MHISYKPLWHTLLERDMRKEDLRLAAGMTTNMIANALTFVDFAVIWRYFGWANQTMSCVTLWAIAVYLEIGRASCRERV